MLIISGEDWVEVSAESIAVQKTGIYTLRFAYSAAKPTGAITSFAASVDLAQIYPKVIGKSLWAKAEQGDVTIAIEELLEA